MLNFPPTHDVSNVTVTTTTTTITGCFPKASSLSDLFLHMIWKGTSGMATSGWDLVMAHLPVANKQCQSTEGMHIVSQFRRRRWTVPRRFRMKSLSFILRSGLTFLLCRSVLSMMVANASRNTASARWNWRTVSALHWQ